MQVGAQEEFRGYRVQWRSVELAGRVFHVVGPADCDALIDDPEVVKRFEQDEYMPYWAEFWPAAPLLAHAVAAWPAADNCHNSLSVLELGCGLGLASLVVRHLGHSVIASDYDEDALAFVRESARRCGLPVPKTQCIDWRREYTGRVFDRIIAADVLYETRNLVPIAAFVRRHLERDGVALICDANRSTADDFERVAREAGLVVEVRPTECREPGGERVIRGRVFQLGHRPDVADGSGAADGNSG